MIYESKDNCKPDPSNTTRDSNITFCRAAIEAAGLGTNQFERAILGTVLGEIPDRQSALREIFRALKPGGVLSITEIVFDPHYQRQATVEEVTNAAGLQKKAVFGNRFGFTLNLEKPQE